MNTNIYLDAYKKFNENQSGMLYSIMQKSVPYIRYFEQSETPTTEIYDAIGSEIFHGINSKTMRSITFFTRLFKNSNYFVAENLEQKNAPIELLQLVDPILNVYSISSRHNLFYTANVYKAFETSKIKTDRPTFNETLSEDIHVVMNHLSNMQPIYIPKNAHERNLGIYMLKFGEIISYCNDHQHNETYRPTLNNDKYPIEFSDSSVKMLNKFKIVSVPRDLQKILFKPGKHFDQIVKLTKLNNDSGFYCYIIDGVYIPIMCKHEFMSYSGVSLSEISIECYKRGKCKYCGQELIPYHERSRESLPPKVYDMIYRYIATFKNPVDTNSVMNILFNVIFELVKANIPKDSGSKYENYVVAFSAVYIYGLYIASKKSSIEYTRRIATYIDLLRDYWSGVGWNQEVIDKTISDKKIMGDLLGVLNQIINKIYRNEFVFSDMLPASILFNKILIPNESETPKPKTEVQKLYIENMSKLGEYNDLIRILSMISRKYESLYNNITKYKTVDYETVIKTISVKNIEDKDIEKFYSLVVKYYCPENGYHEFTNKQDTCKHCGLKSNLSNKLSIMHKYESTMRSQYMQKPHCKDISKMISTKRFDVLQIGDYDQNDLFTKFIQLDDHTLKTTIMQSIDQNKNIDETVKLICGLTSFDDSEIKRTPEFIKQAFCFIIDNKLKDDSDILNELMYMYMKVSNVNILFT